MSSRRFDVPAAWFSETVEVEAYTGEGAYGPVFGAPVTLAANISGSRTLVRNGDGDEVVSETTLRLPPGADGSVAPESRLRFRGFESRAVLVKPHTDAYGRTIYIEVAAGGLRQSS